LATAKICCRTHRSKAIIRQLNCVRKKVRIAPGVRGQGSRHGSAVRVHCVFCDIWGFLCFFGVNNASITDYVLEENNSKTRQHDATGRKCSGEGGADVDFPIEHFTKQRRLCLSENAPDAVRNNSNRLR